jgi:hypothetical protein
MSKLVKKSNRSTAFIPVLRSCGFHPESVFVGQPGINKTVRTMIVLAKLTINPIRERFHAELSIKADRQGPARSQNSKFKVKNYENKTVGNA